MVGLERPVVRATDATDSPLARSFLTCRTTSGVALYLAPLDAGVHPSTQAGRQFAGGPERLRQAPEDHSLKRAGGHHALQLLEFRARRDVASIVVVKKLWLEPAVDAGDPLHRGQDVPLDAAIDVGRGAAGVCRRTGHSTTSL
jgi:hypothetical protein